MDSLNTADILLILVNHKVAGGNRNRFFTELFHSFYVNVGEDFDFSDSRISKWIHGTEKVSSTITDYYSNNKEEELAFDIYSRVFQYLDSPAAVADEIEECIKADPSLNQIMKDELLLCAKKEKTSDHAEFIAHILLFYMKRAFVRKGKQSTFKRNDTSKEGSIKDRPFIFDADPPEPCLYFVGRENRLNELHQQLDNKRKIFVSGLPGIGKSEFVKKYIQLHRESYGEVVYIDYSGDLYSDIASLDFSTDVSFDPVESRFKEHNRFLKTMTKDSLLIIDNFDTTVIKEKLFSVIMNYKCKVIITTRGVFHGREHLILKGMKSENLYELSCKLYTDSGIWKEELYEIYDIVHHHTFVVELISRLMATGILEPSELFEQLKKEPIALESEDYIQSNKDGTYEQATYRQHIRKLFGLSKFSEAMINILKNLSLFGKKEINRGTFGKWMQLRHLNDVNDLVDLGYIQERSERYIKMHQLLIEVLYSDYDVRFSECSTLLGSIKTILFKSQLNTEYRKKLYELTKHMLDIVVNDEPDGYYAFLESIMRTAKTEVADEKDNEKIFEKLKEVYDTLDHPDSCQKALFHYFQALQYSDENEYFRELYIAVSILPEITKKNLTRIVLIHTAWCLEMIKHGEYAQVDDNCRIIIHFLEKNQMEESDEYQITSVLNMMAIRLQAYSEQRILTEKEEKYIKRILSNDIENVLREKVFEEMRFEGNDYIKTNLIAMLAERFTDSDHQIT